MTKTAKARFVIFIILNFLLFLCIFLYTKELSELLKEIKLEHTDAIYIDGTDFSGIFNLGVSFFNNVFSDVSMLLYSVAMLVISAVLFVPFRLISVRKTSKVSDYELKTTLKIILVSTVIIILSGIIFLGINMLAAIVIMLIPVLIFEMLYWFGLKSKNNK